MPLLEQVLEKNPATVKLVFKNFPLQSHEYADKAARAAMAAGQQGKFWEFHDRLFESYNQIDEEKINEIAKSLNLKMDDFEAHRNGAQIRTRVRRDLRDGAQAGVRGTPTVFVNGRRLQKRSIEAFQEVIDRELEKLKKTP